jgi:hypothetical protein
LNKLLLGETVSFVVEYDKSALEGVGLGGLTWSMVWSWFGSIGVCGVDGDAEGSCGFRHSVRRYGDGLQHRCGS